MTLLGRNMLSKECRANKLAFKALVSLSEL